MILARACNHDTCTCLQPWYVHVPGTMIRAHYSTRTWHNLPLCTSVSTSLVPRPHLRGEERVTFGWFLGLHQCWLLSGKNFPSANHNDTAQWHSTFLARQLAIGFAHSKIMKPKESAECNQTLSWTDRWGLGTNRWCLGTDRWGLGTRQSVPRLSRVSLLRLCISMNANNGVKHKGLKQLGLQAMIMSVVTTNYLWEQFDYTIIVC